MSLIYIGPKGGWVSPILALGTIRAAQLEQVSLLDIYEQLIEKAPDEAKLATEQIRAHKRHYSGPIRKRADAQFQLATLAAAPSGARLTDWPMDAEILLERNDVFFDASLFKKVCTELERSEELANQWLAKLAADSPMYKAAAVVPHIWRKVFLQRYVANFDRELAI